MLPAVLQLKGQAPAFGTITHVSDRGLAFDCPSARLSPHLSGQKARLDFDFKSQHYSSVVLVMHIQDTRALLSIRDGSSAALTALYSIDRHTQLPGRAGILNKQQACHTQFMHDMKAVLGDVYLALSRYQGELPRLAYLRDALNDIHPRLRQTLTQAYPMYPELKDSSEDISSELQLVEIERVDEWIRRSSLIQTLSEPFRPLAEKFALNYGTLLHGTEKPTNHPYQLEPLLNILGEQLEPFQLEANENTFCYELMGKAFQKHASTLYQNLLRIIGDVSPKPEQAAQNVSSLEQWLKMSATESHDANSLSEAGEAAGRPVSAQQCDNLTALLARLTENLGNLGNHLSTASRQYAGVSASGSPSANPIGDNAFLVPALLARDRVYQHFLPNQNGIPLTMPSAGTSTGSVPTFDDIALQNLQAMMQQPPPIEPGPERLTQSSQIRTLMLQAQGLLLEYTLNGLNYQSQPDHPAWSLLNALDALHMGADNQGQFLDPTLHQAVSLSMQWLLEQDDADAALLQVNRLLAKINAQLAEERQARRTHHLASLGELAVDPDCINASWCIVSMDGDAIPYEILGKREDTWMLLDRSASDLLEIPTDVFKQSLLSGDIQETASYDRPFLDRTANATLTASLDAVHSYTWQDPVSGCLKRSAVLDELERRLVNPVTNPPSFCALLEIPGMRAGITPLSDDELNIMQKRTGEMLHKMLLGGEHCGRLSDISFLMIFVPQDPAKLANRLIQLKHDIQAIHPDWKTTGAAVPLIEPGEATPTPSSVLRRANVASAPQRQQSGFDLSSLKNIQPENNQIEPLPFSSLYLRCQKISPCYEGGAAHYEILLGVDQDLVPAHTTQSFVVMAEQMGLIQELDVWVLQSALYWMDQNQTEVAQLSGLSINLSGGSLAERAHVDAMLTLLDQYVHLAEKVIFEVTETAAIEHLDTAVRSLNDLRKRGCRVALDDFGSGYSSYSYLRNLPLDYLKIDGTYIRNILTDSTDQALTASMIDVAHALGLKVIAEFVDSEAAYLLLKELGVDYVQGYWVHKPERLDGLLLKEIALT